MFIDLYFDFKTLFLVKYRKKAEIKKVIIVITVIDIAHMTGPPCNK